MILWNEKFIPSSLVWGNCRNLKHALSLCSHPCWKYKTKQNKTGLDLLVPKPDFPQIRRNGLLCEFPPAPPCRISLSYRLVCNFRSSCLWTLGLEVHITIATCHLVDFFVLFGGVIRNRVLYSRLQAVLHPQPPKNLFFFLLLIFFQDRISTTYLLPNLLCKPSWPQTHRTPLASASSVNTMFTIWEQQIIKPRDCIGPDFKVELYALTYSLICTTEAKGGELCEIKANHSYIWPCFKRTFVC